MHSSTRRAFLAIVAIAAFYGLRFVLVDKRAYLNPATRLAHERLGSADTAPVVPSNTPEVHVRAGMPDCPQSESTSAETPTCAPDYVLDATSKYSVCRSLKDPDLWSCPASYTLQDTPPFCSLAPAATKPTNTKSCAVTEAGINNPPLHMMLNGCFAGAQLRDGQQCNLTCLPCWKISGRQPSCHSGTLDAGSISCEFDPVECGKETPTRGSSLCHNNVSHVRPPPYEGIDCVKWRQSSSCEANGVRDRNGDLPCDSSIAADKAGYCECSGRELVKRVKCGHKPFTCKQACDAEATKRTHKIPRVAYCMSGHVRGLFLEKNYHSLKYNLIEAFGADTKIFGYLKLDDSATEAVDLKHNKKEGADSTKPKSVAVTRAMAEPALAALGFTNLTFGNDVYPPPLNPEVRFVPNPAGNPWGKYTPRLVAQLVSMRKCYAMIEDFERATDTVFDMVIRLRPDDFWVSGIRPYCGFSKLRTTTWFPRGAGPDARNFIDTFFIMPRRVAHVVFRLSEWYYSAKGDRRDINIYPLGGVEGWIEDTAVKVSAQTSCTNGYSIIRPVWLRGTACVATPGTNYTIHMNTSFPRSLHRMQKTGKASVFCALSSMPTLACMNVLYADA